MMFIHQPIAYESDSPEKMAESSKPLSASQASRVPNFKNLTLTYSQAIPTRFNTIPKKYASHSDCSGSPLRSRKRLPGPKTHAE